MGDNIGLATLLEQQSAGFMLALLPTHYSTAFNAFAWVTFAILP